MNKAMLLGNVGKDPEIRHTQDGRPIANFSVATSDTWRDKQSGEKKEKTEWHRVVCFNENISKVIEQYVKKGSKVLVEGVIRTRKYESDGQEKYTTEIVIENFRGSIELVGRPKEGPGSPSSEDDYGKTKSFGANPDDGKKFSRELDDEVPF